MFHFQTGISQQSKCSYQVVKTSGYISDIINFKLDNCHEKHNTETQGDRGFPCTDIEAWAIIQFLGTGVSSRSWYSLLIFRRAESYFLPYTFYIIEPGSINGDLSDGIGNIKLNTLVNKWSHQTHLNWFKLFSSLRFWVYFQYWERNIASYVTDRIWEIFQKFVRFWRSIPWCLWHKDGWRIVEQSLCQIVEKYFYRSFFL